jgi:3-hydroxybutyryl-CoA dehydrogenase
MMPELDRHDRPHEYLEAKVACGELGFKTGNGFRSWTENQKEAVRAGLATHLLAALERGRQ